MKFLIFISSLSGGGAERVTTNLANYWAAKGWEITIVTLNSKSDDFYELMPAVKRIALELDGNSSNALIGLIQNFRRMYALRRVLCQAQPDVVLGMMSAANVLLALASWGLSQIRTIGSERTYPPQYPLGVMWERLRRFSYGHLNAVVAQTNEAAAWLRTHTNAKRVVVFPNPVNWPMSNQLPHLDVKNFSHMGRKILLAVGRLSSEKQFALLISCFQSLANLHSSWDLVILGEGPLRNSLEAQSTVAGLENRVCFPGRAGNMGEWYGRADLYVLSSRFEGFPNTLAEAMACGLPAVAFDCDTGPRDIICHGVNGLLVPPDDLAGLTDALNQVMGSDSLRQRLAEQAVVIRERFSTPQIAEMWENLFKELQN